MKRLINHWCEHHTEYEEYHKLQLCTVVRYQHNNTLDKILSNYRYRNNPQKYRDIIFFQYRTPLVWTIDCKKNMGVVSETSPVGFWKAVLKSSLCVTPGLSKMGKKAGRGWSLLLKPRPPSCSSNPPVTQLATPLIIQNFKAQYNLNRWVLKTFTPSQVSWRATLAI